MTNKNFVQPYQVPCTTLLENIYKIPDSVPVPSMNTYLINDSNNEFVYKCHIHVSLQQRMKGKITKIF